MKFFVFDLYNLNLQIIMSIVINSYKPKKIEKREPKIRVNQEDYYYM